MELIQLNTITGYERAQDSYYVTERGLFLKKVKGQRKLTNNFGKCVLVAEQTLIKVSNFYRVLNADRWLIKDGTLYQIIKTYKRRAENGYYMETQVQTIEKKKLNIPRHRIIAFLYHGKDYSEEKNFVDHINRNTLDNRPENLRWVTPIENTLNSDYSSKARKWAHQNLKQFNIDNKTKQRILLDINKEEIMRGSLDEIGAYLNLTKTQVKEYVRTRWHGKLVKGKYYILNETTCND